MKKFLAGVIGLAAMGLAAPASAADVAARPYATPAYSYIPALYDWSGFYIGANGGYGTNRSCWNTLDTTSTFVVASEGCHNATGGVAGAQVGYRWQASSWVFGIEAQGDWAGLRGSNINANPAAVVPGSTNRSRVDSFGLFTAQLGFAMDNVLLYVKGGGAVLDDRYDIYSGGAPLATVAFDQPSWGATAGAGLEYGFAANWTAAIQYDHLFMRDRVVNFTTTIPPSTAPISNERIRLSTDMVTVRVNYRWGGPVIAKY